MNDIIKYKKSESRGFWIGEFYDRYGKLCNIQDSSLATEACIWLGISNPKVQNLVPGEGWKEVDLPDDALIESRMHLTVNQAKNLVKALNIFIETETVGPESV